MEWEAWYPFECFSGFWSYLTKLNILIVPEVIEECSNDNFDRWFKLLGDTQRFEPTTESLRLAAKLEDKFPGCKPRGAQNLADLQVAAAAKLNGGTILTEETSKPGIQHTTNKYGQFGEGQGLDSVASYLELEYLRARIAGPVVFRLMANEGLPFHMTPPLQNGPPAKVEGKQ